MQRMRRLAATLATVLAATCARPSDAPLPAGPATLDVVTADVPGGRVNPLPDPALRIPRGSRVVRTGVAGTASLSDGMAAAGAPSVRWDGARVLFVGRERDTDTFDVWECAADGSDRRVVVRHGTDCQAAAHLPDGRIVYAAALAEPSPMTGVRSSQALFVAKGDGTAGARITFGAGLDADPTVLCDGRVLFASWRTSAAGARLGLFTVHPDGTGFAAFHLGSDDAVLPVQQADLDVRFTTFRDGSSKSLVADWDAPMSVVTEATDAVATLPLAPRPRPQGQLSTRREDRPWVTLVCVDARRGLASPAVNAATAVRVRSGGRVLGDVPLASDGSFHVRAPVDTPITLETLDAQGRSVVAEHAPFWGRNNEVRVCVGCHDDVETAPPNVRPRAILADPVDLSGPAPAETVR